MLGPPGRWQLVGAAGVERLSPRFGLVPGAVEVVLPPSGPFAVGLELQYVAPRSRERGRR